jgi:hypothetical protein
MKPSELPYLAGRLAPEAYTQSIRERIHRRQMDNRLHNYPEPGPCWYCVQQTASPSATPFLQTKWQPV